jgi:hypothetical protein
MRTKTKRVALRVLGIVIVLLLLAVAYPSVRAAVRFLTFSRALVRLDKHYDKAQPFDPLAMNQYFFLTEHAASLQYPPVADTVAYWGDGRFQLLDLGYYVLTDMKTDTVQCPQIESFHYERPIVYMKTVDGWAMLDVQQGDVKRLESLEGLDDADRRQLENLPLLRLEGFTMEKTDPESNASNR